MKRKRFVPNTLRQLSPLPEGWFDVSYSITIDGALLRLWANADVVSSLKRRRELQGLATRDLHDEINAEIRKPLFQPGTLARIHVENGASESLTAEFPLEYPSPLFDRLPDGRWVIANARCKSGYQNARILDFNGRALTRLYLGDGIEHLQCDDESKIWVGYFDEGVFGITNATPLGAPGLIQFNTDGAIDWSFAPPTPEGPWIADCVSLNVSSVGAWCCVYTDFPILRIDTHAAPRVWLNEVAGAKAIAVDGEHVALLGGYGSDETRIALLRLDNTSAEPLALFDLDLGNNQHIDYIGGRAETLHVISGHKWYRISIAELIAFARIGLENGTNR